MADIRSTSLGREIDQLCDEFEAAWKRESPLSVESLLERTPSSIHPALFRELLNLDLAYRRMRHEHPDQTSYANRFPQHASIVAEAFRKFALEADQTTTPSNRESCETPDSEASLAHLQTGAPRQTNTEQTFVPAQPLAAAQEQRLDPDRTDYTPLSTPAQNHNTDSTSGPEKIGRYLIRRVLGEGGFGRVYLAYDNQLERQVALKVPHARLVSRAEDAKPYLAEARTVAGLDHAHIVPVYDVSSTAECPFFIVSKYVEGTDLARKMQHSRCSFAAAADLVATVAEALHYAHKQGLVHRDIKPGNLLIDNDDQPYVVDFGLALREENLGQGPKFAGTPAYMSPEQARGKGHRVDGRSDIFSLGVVLYELLVGRRPFSGATSRELLEQITTLEPKPPRQINDKIPPELERITLKCLAKRVTERYSTALDLAHDLRRWERRESGVSPRILVQFLMPTLLIGILGFLGLKQFWHAERSALDTKREGVTNPAQIVPSELVEQFRVIHFRDRQDSSELTGEIGVDTLQAHTNDSVRVHAKFRQPVYCYLLAFNPDGQEQICYPTDETSVPVLSSSLEYPQDTSEAFYLTDGAGQQAFAMVVSHVALPPYQKWRSQIGQVPWHHVDCDAVLRFGGETVQVCRVDRGTVGKLKGVDVFEQLCHFLREKSPVDVVQAVAFPVLQVSK